jgi:hypothetical protein
VRFETPELQLPKPFLCRKFCVVANACPNSGFAGKTDMRKYGAKIEAVAQNAKNRELSIWAAFVRQTNRGSAGSGFYNFLGLQGKMGA